MNLKLLKIRSFTKIVVFIMLVLFCISSVCVSMADTTPRYFDLDKAGMDVGGSKNIEDLAVTWINYMALFISVFAIIWIMIWGIVLMTAYGQEEQIQKGKSIILYSILGLIFTISAYIIVSFVQTIVYSVGS